MKRFLVGTVINSLALWLVTLVIPAIKISPWGGTETWNLVVSYVFVGMIFGLVTAIIAPVIKVLAFPLYILTFGLISFVINGALLLFVAWLSSQIGSDIFTIDGFTSEGLSIESMGWAILGAAIISIASLLGRWVFKILRIL